MLAATYPQVSSKSQTFSTFFLLFYFLTCILFTMYPNNKESNAKHDVSIASLNVRGINDSVKRTSVFRWLRKNKFDVVFLQETYCSEKNENTWKNEWNGNIVYAHGSNHSKGTMILFKSGFDCKIIQQKCDSNGRFIILEIEVEGNVFILVNIYAPNKETEKRSFFKDVYAVMKSMEITPEKQIIAGGDWNSIFESIDKCGGKQQGGNVVQELSDIINELDLVDVWRIRNPLLKRFTYRQKTPLIQSRLDYFLVADQCQDIVTFTDIIPSVQSDHSAIVIYLKFIPEWPKGGGHWKFNSRYLDDGNFVAQMNVKLKEWLDMYKDIRDKRVQWEMLKYEIRRYCMKYGKDKKSEQNVYTGNLLYRLKLLETELSERPSDQVQQKYYSIKEELRKIEQDKAKGCMIRSRARYIEEGEKPTHYFSI